MRSDAPVCAAQRPKVGATNCGRSPTQPRQIEFVEVDVLIAVYSGRIAGFSWRTDDDRVAGNRHGTAKSGTYDGVGVRDLKIGWLAPVGSTARENMGRAGMEGTFVRFGFRSLPCTPVEP